MSNIEKRTFSIPTEHSVFIDSKISSGGYASASEVVRAGLRALQERDRAMENWLRTEVCSVYDAMKADPSRGVLAKNVFDEIRSRHVMNMKGDM